MANHGDSDEEEKKEDDKIEPKKFTTENRSMKDEKKMDSEEAMIKKFEESSSLTFKGQSDVIHSIQDEDGYIILLAGICNWLAKSSSDVHPCLSPANKKIGVGMFPIDTQEKVVGILYMEDFVNLMV